MWETGEAAPTVRQLEGFAAATHAPLGYFFLPEPPDEPVPIPDFRTVADRAIERASADLLDTVYICQQRQAWYRQYLSDSGGEALGFVGSVRHGANVVDTAARIGRAIGFSVEERASYSTWAKALREFIQLVEDAGILIMVSGIVLNNTHRKLDPDEFRGFTIADELAPLVFINGADSKSGQMFTLAHELAHVWAGESALGNPQPRQLEAPQRERWFNAVAAELLVPAEAIREAFSADADLDEEKQRLAAQFKVSTLVILRRIHDIGGLTRDAFWEAFDAEVERIRELDVRTGTGGDFHKNEALRVGRRFGAALVASTLAGETMYRDAFRLLGISKTETLEKFGRELGLRA